MSKFLFLLAAFALTVTASAKSPFIPEIEKRFYQLEHPSGTTGASLTSGSVLVGNTAGKAAAVALTSNSPNGLLHVAKATYDFAVQGGAQAALSLGVTIPANSTIIRSWIYTITQVAGASSTVALSCETANNIFSAAAMTSITAGTLTEGVSTGAASVFKPVTAACPITATIATANVTAGKFNVYVEYVVHD